MGRRYFSNLGLIMLAIGFLAFTALNNTLLYNFRLDLTENNLFTLSDGSKQIVKSIDESINLYFFFSNESSKNLPQVRSYAKRVSELLQEYALAANGKINLTIIDPEPFSEEEDLATEFGLQSLPLTAAGDGLYFGLAGTNALDDVEIISFFQPDKEEFLEYDISKLLQSLVLVEKPIVGIMSSLPVQGNMNMQTFQMTPGWVSVEQLDSSFNIQELSVDIEEIPSEIDILMLIHPKQLSDGLLFSIDQFVMKGGRLLAFTDPLAETDRPQQPNPMMPSAPTDQASSLNRLTEFWGISMRDNIVLGDSQTALAVTGPSGTPVRHLGILGMEADNFSRDDVVTSALESINFATAGVLEVSDTPPGDIHGLVFSSPYSMPLDSFQFQFLTNPEDLMREFSPTGEQYLISARLSGFAPTAFPNGLEGSTGKQLMSTDNIGVILVADTDLLTDRLWVQVQNFFGQQLATPWANNGDLVSNALENLSGGEALISIRSRGRFSRPFDVVQDLRREAEARYLENANNLQERLAATEQKLSELQSVQGSGNLLVLSPEQEVALADFQDEKYAIRKQLRDVRHQLDRDIKQLGSSLKFINIALVPILITLALLILNFLRLGKREEG